MSTPLAPDVPPPSIAEVERRRVIAATIEGLRERLRSDGGDLTLVSIDGPRVRVRLAGACVGCGAANETLGWIRRQLSLALGGGPVTVVPALGPETTSTTPSCTVSG